MHALGRSVTESLRTARPPRCSALSAPLTIKRSILPGFRGRVRRQRRPMKFVCILSAGSDRPFSFRLPEAYGLGMKSLPDIGTGVGGERTVALFPESERLSPKIYRAE